MTIEEGFLGVHQQLLDSFVIDFALTQCRLQWEVIITAKMLFAKIGYTWTKENVNNISWKEY